jgi:N-formylglutamate amidohydrolase
MAHTTVKQGSFVNYRAASGLVNVVLDAPHAARPSSDLHTGSIVQQAADRLACHVVVGLVSRTVADLNRAPTESSRGAVSEYRQFLEQAVMAAGLDPDGKLTRDFLHLSIHGMKDREEYDFELGTRDGETCSPQVESWAMDVCGRWATALPNAPRVALNRRFRGDPVLEVHRHGDGSGYGGFGTLHNTIQIEFSRTLREDRADDVARLLVELGRGFAAGDPFREP